MIEIPMIDFNKGDNMWLQDLQRCIKEAIKNNESEALYILDRGPLANFDWEPVLSYIKSINESVISIGGTSSQNCIPNILYNYRLYDQNDHNIHKIEQKLAEESIRRKKTLLPNQILV